MPRKSNAERASEMMKRALKEVHNVVNDPSVQTLPVSPDHFHAYVVAHMNVQAQLDVEDQLSSVAVTVSEVDARNEIGALEEATKQALLEVRMAVESLDFSDACPDLSDLESTTKQGFEDVVGAIKRGSVRPWVADR